MWATHRYGTTECPECGHDLTGPRGVIIEGYSPGIGHGEVFSCLDHNGLLQDTEEEFIRKGLHSDTFCGKCRTSLADEEIED